MNDKIERNPSLLHALIPVVFLISALSANVFVLGDAAVSGSNQVVILTSAALACLIGMLLGVKWTEMQHAIARNITTAAIPILILLMVGALSGTWLVSGIVPLMIYYGLQLLSPEFFLPATCIICALVSLATGSSWTTAATIGVALMGIGKALGFDPGLVAGAAISGSYFGDKLSPLSDTTNLAAAVADTNLFTHIRYMMYTTTPSILISLVAFFFIGLSYGKTSEIVSTTVIMDALNARFHLHAGLILVPLAVLVMVVKRVPALPAIFVGALLGAVCALVLQPALMSEIGEQAQVGIQGGSAYAGFMQMVFGDIAIGTGNASIDELLTSGGMAGMMGTIWLILAAMTFGGAMEASGLLACITKSILRLVDSARSLVASTVGTCLFVNVSASDQYLSVVLPGRMFADTYKKQGLAPQNLSRTLEDSGTVTSVLVPWNTCGAYHAGVLGVATLSYLPYCFFNLISPLMTLLFAFLSIRIMRVRPGDPSRW